MTKSQARKKLGVGRSANLTKAQEAYSDRRGELQRQLVPGMPRETREVAHDELLELASAWQTVSAQPVCLPNRAPEISRTPLRRNRPAETCSDRRDGHTGFWDNFNTLLPISRVNAAAIIIAALILILVWALNIVMEVL